ncbi:hypothetical protein CCACVL1_11554 [Corchorus capsularis]|uniref:Uncharacterized protein n=1 Tax=Corchorus capsularis TaxID=210143 RepID=A0A1R3IKP2_COCAP|nr:hypothetical protein CCACVL1_11554 [Corchorus capsularis]
MTLPRQVSPKQRKMKNTMLLDLRERICFYLSDHAADRPKREIYKKERKEKIKT